MLTHLLELLGGLVLLYLGAEGLVRGSASLALRLGVTPLMIGLTVVAYGTSAPELVVSTKAALDGQGDIAVGNIVGSNIFNICVILGLASAIRPLRVRFQLLKLDAPVMIGVSLLCLGFLADRRLARWEAVIFLGSIAAYTLFNVLQARRQATREIEAGYEQEGPKRSGALWLDLVLIVGGLAVLVLGSRFLVNGAVAVARIWGVSEAVIGLTIVAAGTSMPELATSVVGAITRQPDIALGNVIGSNIFNILGILGVSGLLRPLNAPGVSSVDLGLMVVTAILLLPMLWSNRTVSRAEGLVLVAVYAGYLYHLWPKG